MEQDWDLYAVVRGCSTVTSSTTTTTATTSSTSSSTFATCYNPAASSSCQSLSISNPFEAKNSSIEELHELCKPFFLKSHPSPSSSSFQTSSPISSFSYSPSSPKPRHTQPKQQPHHYAGSATTPRSKRRKNQLKKVCQVAAENLSSDIWAWRKYGQKPIKGSPYPRGYYRCSSSKGCLARKQVERNRSEPTMFIVTYTGEHNHPAPSHRNSLAGSTRQKPLTPETATGEESDKLCAKTTSPETSGAEEEVELGTKSESKEDIEELMNDDEEENEFGLPDMVLNDDFFEGLDELTGSIASPNGVCFGDPFPDSVSLPT
ncbi:hypothetical protein Lal_00031280 [Lupinus albus]|uniref:Putative transcription factor WRKY family n=1 Tax=Lupinus albus TaxID=3870 RepID=A0A6A5LU66_LUPAL|nr:putative transcription factor WRKY family [Lupinus albus]KAF1863393.1 hypothetical protein Lal_00031280 [Lupinus albus]